MAEIIPPERIYPESIEPSETNGQILRTVDGEVTWTNESSSGGSSDGLDLSGALFYYLDGTPEIYGEFDEIGIVSVSGGFPQFSFSEIPVLDPTHTYEIEASFDTGFGGTYEIRVYGIQATTDDGLNDGDFSNLLYDNTNDLSSGSVTFQIGPGIEGWDDSVVSENNLYLMFETHPSTRLIELIFTDLDEADVSLGIPVFLLEEGQSIFDYETANSVTIPTPAIIARKTA